MKTWDKLAFELLGDEYLMRDLAEAQRVTSWASPVYSFTVDAVEDVQRPANADGIATAYKAPWED